jgi:hypothetical protein
VATTIKLSGIRLFFSSQYDTRRFLLSREEIQWNRGEETRFFLEAERIEECGIFSPAGWFSGWLGKLEVGAGEEGGSFPAAGAPLHCFVLGRCRGARIRAREDVRLAGRRIGES